ncbi:restriction endonuclease subunit S [Persephonella sp.]
MIKTKTKNVPELRFPEFKDEWIEIKIVERTSLIKDGTHVTHKESPNSGYYLLSAKNIKDGKIVLTDNEREISRNDFNQIFNSYKLKKGDILLSIVGTIGNVAIYNIDNLNIAFQRSVAILRFNKDYPKFIFQLFLTPIFQKELNKSKVVSVQAGIYLNDLSKIKIHIPPTLKEQKKIADFLSLIDEKIQLQSQKIEKLENYKKGLMQKLLTGKLRFPEFKGKWVERRLGDVLYELKKNKVPLYKLREYELLSVKLHTKGLEKTGKKPNITKKGRPYFIVEEGDILIGKQNFHYGSIGIVTKEFSGLITSNAILHLREKKNVDKYYIVYYLSQFSFYKKIELLIGGTGQKEISKKELFNLKVIIPPTLEEQQKIADFLSVIDEKIELNKKKLEKLKEYKRGLLQKMFV